MQLLKFAEKYETFDIRDVRLLYVLSLFRLFYYPFQLIVAQTLKRG
jgi:hypothetical protein